MVIDICDCNGYQSLWNKTIILYGEGKKILKETKNELIKVYNFKCDC